MTTVERYRNTSRRFLDQAVQELDAGDLQQASEKGWGAASQILKAAAAQRQWGHDSHRLLFKVVDALVKETGDGEIDELFYFANGLHQNFCENWLSAEAVRRGLDSMGQFVEKLEPLVGPSQALP